MENQTEYVNIAYYKFVAIEDVPALRAQLQEKCSALHLKGTIILAHEGINSCLVGSLQSIDHFIEFMHADTRFSDIEFKKSTSTHLPFRKMIVKVKKEIIPLGMESIKPAESTGQYVNAQELKKWFDEKEDMLILDTRNDYEVELGTFRNAINPNLKEFRKFPEWVKENLSEHKNKKIITFCTGGIRCEKATAFMQQEGFDNVYQVHGGILKYLEETAKNSPDEDNHYDGDCFVFDHRVAVDKKLQQSKYLICYNCWRTLTEHDLTHENYKKELHCGYCYEFYLQKQRAAQRKIANNRQREMEVRKERSEQFKKFQKSSISLNPQDS